MRKFILILFFICSLNLYSQKNNSFIEGLNKGWADTMYEAKNIDVYSAGSPDAIKCSTIPSYSINDKNINQKEYSRGYRCGVEQATKVIPLLQKKLQDKISTSSDYSGNEININNIQDLEHLNSLRLTEISNIRKSGHSSQEENARIQQIELKYQELRNKLSHKLSGVKNNLTNNENISLQNRDNYNKQINNNLMNYYSEQQNMQQQYNNSVQNQINSMSVGLSNQLQAIANQNLQIELSRRQNVANNFINLHSNSLKGLIVFLKKILILF